MSKNKQNPQTNLKEVLPENKSSEDIDVPRATSVVFNVDDPDLFVIPEFEGGNARELGDLRSRFSSALVSHSLPSGPFYQVSPEPPLVDDELLVDDEPPDFPTSGSYR